MCSFCSDKRRMKMEKSIRRYDANSPLTPCNLCCGQVSATHHLARVSLSLPTPSSTSACLAPWAMVTPGRHAWACLHHHAGSCSRLA